MPFGASRAGLMSVAADDIPDSDDLHAYYDATELNLSDDDSVSTWTEETGNENDLTQETSDNQPTFKTEIINGNSVIRHDGDSDFLITTFQSTLQQALDVFIVAQKRSVGTDDRQRLFASDTADEVEYFSGNDSEGNNWAINAGERLDSTTNEDTDPHIFHVKLNGTESIMRLDGSQIASGDVGANNLGGLTTAARGSGDVEHGDFDHGEILLYPDRTTSQIESVESYLADKWGITI